MKQTPVPSKGSPAGQVTTPVKPATEAPHSSYDAQRQFISAAMNMSWQLAIVVLVPIIGGYKLDQKLNMVPLLTIVGFILAMIGMVFVVWRQMQLNSPVSAKRQRS